MFSEFVSQLPWQKHVTKGNWGRGGFIWLTGYRLYQGKPRQKFKARTEVEAVEECYLLPCSPWLAQLVFFNTTQDLGTALPTVGSSQNQLLTKKIPHEPIWWRPFLSWGIQLPQFPGDSRLCQVDKKLTNLPCLILPTQKLLFEETKKTGFLLPTPMFQWPPQAISREVKNQPWAARGCYHMLYDIAWPEWTSIKLLLFLKYSFWRLGGGLRSGK